MNTIDLGNLETAVYLRWNEFERGLGARNDGCSLYLTLGDCKVFLDAYWKTMPDKTPDIYSQPPGEPVPVLISPDLYKRVQDSKHGLRLLESEEQELSIKKKLLRWKDLLEYAKTQLKKHR